MVLAEEKARGCGEREEARMSFSKEARMNEETHKTAKALSFGGLNMEFFH